MQFLVVARLRMLVMVCSGQGGRNCKGGKGNFPFVILTTHTHTHALIPTRFATLNCSLFAHDFQIAVGEFLVLFHYVANTF